MENKIGLILIVCVCAAFIFGLAYELFKYFKPKKSKSDDDYDEAFEPELLCEKAEIVFKDIGIIRTGAWQNPTTKTGYRVTFKLENGEIKEFDVPFESFQNYHLHDKGNLITLNDNFFDFGLGEEPENIEDLKY